MTRIRDVARRLTVSICVVLFVYTLINWYNNWSAGAQLERQLMSCLGS